MSSRRTNTNTCLIRKTANRFSVGEVLYLFGCDTGTLYGVLRGPFSIEQIKHQSDTGVSFFLRPVVIPMSPGAGRPVFQRSYFVEFARSELLARMGGPPLPHIIQEVEVML